MHNKDNSPLHNYSYCPFLFLSPTEKGGLAGDGHVKLAFVTAYYDS